MDGFRLCQVLREHLDQVQEGDRPMIYSFQPKDKETAEATKKLFTGFIDKLDEAQLKKLKGLLKQQPEPKNKFAYLKNSRKGIFGSKQMPSNQQDEDCDIADDEDIQRHDLAAFPEGQYFNKFQMLELAQRKMPEKISRKGIENQVLVYSCRKPLK